VGMRTEVPPRDSPLGTESVSFKAAEDELGLKKATFIPRVASCRRSRTKLSEKSASGLTESPSRS